nr:MAG TPA: hypothetical protein [Caudoviricetes sp.]
MRVLLHSQMMRWHWRISEKVRLTKVRKKKA